MSSSLEQWCIRYVSILLSMPEREYGITNAGAWDGGFHTLDTSRLAQQ
ncbi:hypothetical protein H6F98_10480 [Microcoleus sp. FACHB-SPT15]|nr:hypothetical protein [Microcoleus sp. FACHB-SPT15]MBD1805875.1 hypothetical protein [Microcoleus sp. FACHB-SPT15]